MNKNTQDIMFSSNKQDWRTPKYLFEQLNNEFKFNIDLAADDNNHLCDNYYTKQNSALDFKWNYKSCFLNPPYNEIAYWVEKAYFESLHGTTVVMLIPARTDTKYFHKYCTKSSEIRFIKGRLKFSEGNNAAPFPSMIVIFNKNNNKYANMIPYIENNIIYNTNPIYTKYRNSIKIIK